ncbi:MAG: 16S rRNA (guanine(527)-N(7))-methyltransferase RsmG [Propionibacteriales bacterium]|nr:16S rRNA (guanine(527)-N(7))-methyltransferase RsmG [Propionibacteriales bacterium]
MRSSPPPSPPAVAADLFPGARLALAVRYAELLATEGVIRGLIGPREAPRLWDRHLINCALLSPALPEGAIVVDIGSGAGLPGLVIAIARPDVSITLVEPLLRRTTFLEEVVVELGLTNVTVVRGRADVLHGKQTFDVVTSRAVAPLERLLGWSMPLVAPRGALVAMKGSSAAEEVAAAGAVLSKLGCAPPAIEILGEDVVAAEGVDPIQVVRVAWADPSGVSLPVRGARGSRESRPGTSRSKRRKS